MTRDGGWPHRAQEVAGFDPIRYKAICRSCTVLDVAMSWKSLMASSDFAFSDKNAEAESINWV